MCLVALQEWSEERVEEIEILRAGLKEVIVVGREMMVAYTRVILG